ncbi:unnamed protein product [Darwinula stevensoni]|uniref:Uncharacterized protein n=1 Tax=Darwinula stevensoni TaxID=69355 RepID=A0A7R9FST5_9CRUS|nr:unnamed protein product [Darwinula stevensoni]CAG0904455.1 unnamed protein product [Darwinula stevensoni]
MSFKKYESGAAKRKAKKHEQEEIRKHPKVTSYFATSSRKQSETPREYDEESVLSTEEKVSSLESDTKNKPDTSLSAMDVEQDGKVLEDDAYVPKESKTIAEDFEPQASTCDTSPFSVLDQDPAKWPSHINEAARDYCVEKGPEYFQNNDGEYTASCSFPTLLQKLTDALDKFANAFQEKAAILSVQKLFSRRSVMSRLILKDDCSNRAAKKLLGPHCLLHLVQQSCNSHLLLPSSATSQVTVKDVSQKEQ